MPRWPITTLLGITCAVIIGTVHASLNALADTLLGKNEADTLAPHQWADGFGPHGY